MNYPARFLFSLLLVAPALIAQGASTSLYGRALSHEDYDSWNSLSSVAYSNDGKWIAYQVLPVLLSVACVTTGCLCVAYVTKFCLSYQILPLFSSVHCVTKHCLCDQVLPVIPSIACVTKWFLCYQVLPVLPSVACVTKHRLCDQVLPVLPIVAYVTRCCVTNSCQCHQENLAKN